MGLRLPQESIRGGQRRGGGGLPQTLQGGLGRPVIAVWGFRSESGGGG